MKNQKINSFLFTILLLFSCKSNQICFNLSNGILLSNDHATITKLSITDCNGSVYKLCLKADGIGAWSINYCNIDTVNYILLHAWQDKKIPFDSLYKPNCQYKIRNKSIGDAAGNEIYITTDSSGKVIITSNGCKK